MKILQFNKAILIMMLTAIIFTACNSEPQILLENNDNNFEGQEAFAEKDEIIAVSSDLLYVHVTGAVNNPGVVEMTAGSRLFEAISKAGGFAENAAMDYCNLAVIVSDGEQYYIPTIDEARYLKSQLEASADAELISHYDDAGRLDINLATKSELMELPGIGSTRADAIIAYRESAGGFLLAEDIMQVSGIKDNLYGQIKDYIYVR